MRVPPRDAQALKYLEALQRDAMLNFAPTFGQATEQELLDGMREAIDLGLEPAESDQIAIRNRVRKATEVAQPERWSQVEPPTHRYYLDRAERQTMAGLEARGLNLPPAVPPIGTLPTFQMNAMAIRVPDSSGSVIVFESGMFDFTAFWGKIVTACLFSDWGEAVVGQFIDLVFSQVVLGTASWTERWKINPQIVERSERDSRPAFEVFLMGHEYGHILLGHHDSIALEPDGRSARELETDAFGLDVTTAAYNNPRGVYLSVQALFCGLLLMERGYGLVHHMPGARQPTDTHPACADRRSNFMRLGRERLPEQQFTEVSHYLAVIEAGTLRLWNPLEGALWRAREDFPEGWQPSNHTEKRAALGRFLELMAAE